MRGQLAGNLKSLLWLVWGDGAAISDIRLAQGVIGLPNPAPFELRSVTEHAMAAASGINLADDAGALLAL